jgi:hypothetical protein
VHVLSLFALFALSVAQAGVILVSESGLGANGSIDFTGVADFTTFASGNFAVTGIPGLTVGITDAGSSFEWRSQGSGWAGNFAPGEPLLWTRDANGPITLAFSSPIWGLGMQIQSDSYGAFSAIIEAFDSLGNPLGSVTRTDGNSTDASDDSAIFMGLLSDSGNVSRVRISVPTATGAPNDFAISGPQIQSTGAEVPEPASVLLFGSGSLALMAFARRRRSA